MALTAAAEVARCRVAGPACRARRTLRGWRPRSNPQDRAAHAPALARGEPRALRGAQRRPAVMEFMWRGPMARFDSDAWVARMRPSWAANGYGLWIDGPEFVGFVGLADALRGVLHPRGRSRLAAGPAILGRGYATEGLGRPSRSASRLPACRRSSHSWLRQIPGPAPSWSGLACVATRPATSGIRRCLKGTQCGRTSCIASPPSGNTPWSSRTRPHQWLSSRSHTSSTPASRHPGCSSTRRGSSRRRTSAGFRSV